MKDNKFGKSAKRSSFLETFVIECYKQIIFSLLHIAINIGLVNKIQRIHYETSWSLKVWCLATQKLCSSLYLNSYIVSYLLIPWVPDHRDHQSLLLYLHKH